MLARPSASRRRLSTPRLTYAYRLRRLDAEALSGLGHADPLSHSPSAPVTAERPQICGGQPRIAGQVTGKNLA